MKSRKIITLLLSTIMLIASVGIVSSSAEENSAGAIVDIAECNISNGTLTYELSAEDVSEYDIYTAVYSSNGALIGVKKERNERNDYRSK